MKHASQIMETLHLKFKPKKAQLSSARRTSRQAAFPVNRLQHMSGFCLRHNGTRCRVLVERKLLPRVRREWPVIVGEEEIFFHIFFFFFHGTNPVHVRVPSYTSNSSNSNISPSTLVAGIYACSWCLHYSTSFIICATSRVRVACFSRKYHGHTAVRARMHIYLHVLICR